MIFVNRWILRMASALKGNIYEQEFKWPTLIF